MKSIYYLSLFALLALSQTIYAQSFTGTYAFGSVTATSGTTDPSPVPTATGLTFGSFSAVGASANPNATSRFSFTGWPTGATNGSNTFTGSINTTQYYQVTLTPSVGCSIDLNNITFALQRSATGIRQYAVRSSVDGYAANLSASINPTNANLSVVATNVFQVADVNTAQAGTTVTLGTAYDVITTPVTFRFYGFNAEATTGTFSIDDVAFNGVSLCGTPCSITAISVTQTAPCDDNFTPATTTDDFYTASVTVTYANAPTSGNLVLSGSSLTNSTETVAVGNLGSTTSYTFTGVPIYASGSPSTITATFDTPGTCTFTNSTIAAVASCSVPPVCGISAIAVGTPSACNDNGTPANSADDYYTANVTVDYTNPATSGNLVLSGDASATVAFFTLSTTQHVFANVQLPADGTTNTLTATFSATPTCTFTNNAITAVNSCSTAPPCNISAVALSNTGSCNDNGSPTNTTDDYYTTDVTVTYANAPATGNLVLSGGASATVAVGSLTSSTSHTFSIQLPADGTTQSLTATFSGASPACAFTNSSIAAVAACSTPLICSMTNVALSNISTCNTNGTAFDPADDYYTTDVTVTYANAPFTGNLVLSGSASSTVAVGSLGSATSHTFTGIQLPADGATKTLTAAFSADGACTFTNSSVAAVASCATCQMNTIVLSNISTCNNNGTIGNFADDTYTANVTINYINPPTTGNLVLSGDASATIAVTSIGATSYTFTSVTLPADGTLNTLTASFDASSCTLTNAAIAAVNGCSGAPSFALTSCGTSVSENFNSFAGVAASLPGGWASSSTDYGPGGYYSNTGAYLGSNSTYALGSATDAAYGVKLPSSASPENLSYCVTNNTGSTILSMNVAWNIEQYSAAERPTTVDFFYSIDGGTTYIQTNITGTTLTAAATAGTPANLASVISTPRSIIINGLSIAQGATFCYRFRIIANAGAAGSNAHIGVDDLVVTPNCTLPCAISAIAVTNTVCSDNGTPNNLTDDTYAADVTVTYANAPATGTLLLSGDGSATVAASAIGATSYTFMGVTMPADGTANTLSATFSTNSLCTFTNAAIAAVASCSTPSTCAISSISVTQGACSDNGTPNNSTDDTYTANVTVNYANPETTGNLVLSGDGSATVAVDSLSSSTSHTFTGVTLPADGTSNTLTATFSANPSCTVTNASIAAVNSCSVPLAVIQLTNCNTTSATETFNTYAGSAATVPTGWTITTTLPQSGLYNNTSTLGASNAVYGLLANGVGTETAMGAKVAANTGNPTGTGLATFQYCTTNQTGNTLAGLGLAWDVEQYSEGLRATIVDLQYKVGAGTYAAVTGSAVTAQTNATGANIVPPVITNKTATLAVPVLPAQQVCFLFSIKTGAGSGNNAHIGIDNFAVTPLCCNISNISLSNLSACNNNGTVPGNTDDTYTADVTVTFANAPATGNLVLSGSVSATESVSNLDGTTTHTFMGVTLSADGTTKSITAIFDADAACTLTNNSIAAVASCSVPVCGISGISIAPTAVCSDNGTPANPNDDYYLADVTVTYAFAPATGNLVLSGNALAAPAINPQVAFIGASNYVFTGIKLKANGSANTLTATFDANASCTNSTTTTATPSCSVACPASFGVFPPTGAANHN